MSPKDADGIANSVVPDQSSLIWVCTVCPDLSVRRLRIITVLRSAWESTQLYDQCHHLRSLDNYGHHWTTMDMIYFHIDIKYCNDPMFLERLVWANSADPDQAAPRGAV